MLKILPITKLFVFLIFALPANHCKDNLSNAFFIEYFLYRTPSIVVGFVCDQQNNNIELIKKFSAVYIKSRIFNLQKFLNISLFAEPGYYKLGIFIDLRCEIFENIKLAFNKAANHKMFDELYYWLILGSDLNKSLSMVTDNVFGLSTNFVIAIVQNNECILYDIYNPYKLRGGKLKITRFAIWKITNGLNIFIKINKIHRWNLEGITIKLGGLIKEKPKNMSIIEYLQNFKMKNIDLSTKVVYKLWNYLSEMFNFTLEFQEYFIEDNSKESNTVITALIQGDIDATVTAYAITNEHMSFVKNVYQAFLFRTFFIFRNILSDRLNIRNIFLPLSSTVWYSTLGLIILSVNVLVFLSIFTEKNIYENYFSSILVHISAFCQQGIEFSPNNLSRRIALLHILLFNLLLYNYYLASVVSNRLSEPTMFVNDSLTEFKKQNFQYASEPMFNFDHYVKNNDSEIISFYNNKWLKIPKSQRFMSPEKGMALVFHGGFAYHTRPEISYPYIDRNFDPRKICEIQEIHLVKPIQLSIFLQTNSSFTEMLKAGFIKLSEVGIRYHEIEIFALRKPKCRSDLLTAESITLNEVSPIIIFLIFSILVSSVILIGEFIIF